MASQRLGSAANPSAETSPDDTQQDSAAHKPQLPEGIFGDPPKDTSGEGEYGQFEPEELPDLPEDLLQPEEFEPDDRPSGLITDSEEPPDLAPDPAAPLAQRQELAEEDSDEGFLKRVIAKDDPFAIGPPEPVKQIGADSLPQPQRGASAASETRMGILGGKQSGKSYLLHALIYRIQAAAQAGALSPYLRGGRVGVYQADSPDEKARLSSLNRFIRAYKSWARLAFTERGNQAWYKLALTFRSGLLGTSKSTFQIGFMDTSGEYREMDLCEESSQEWRETFLNVGVMAFCLPLWAAFPAPGLNAEEKERRQLLLNGFEKVVNNYHTLIEGHDSQVRTMLVLTMADDRRGNLPDLADSWILPVLNEPEEHLRQMRREQGVARYLLNARIVSETLHEEFEDAQPEIARIPEMLNFGTGRPWIIPVSAIEGATLDSVEKSGLETDVSPVPAHVELPLLLALCESYNALM